MSIVWKYIDGFNQWYMVSNTGEIKMVGRYRHGKRVAKRYYPEQIFNVYIRPNGYGQIRLSKGSKSTGYLVHRLVAAAFIPNPNNLPCVNHKDGNKQNNNVDNLEWVTHKENMAHAIRTGLQKMGGENMGNSVLKNDQVREIKTLLKQGERGNKLAKVYGVSKFAISCIKRNKTWKHITI